MGVSVVVAPLIDALPTTCHVVALGAVDAPEGEEPGPGDLERVDASPVRAYSDTATARMVAEVDAAHANVVAVVSARFGAQLRS